MLANAKYDDNLLGRGGGETGSELSKPDYNVIEHAILPRKLIIEFPVGMLRILVNNGEIVSYQKPEASEPTWVTAPVSNTEQKTLDELEAQAGEALESGTLVIAMLDDEEKGALKKHLPSVVKRARTDGRKAAEVLILKDRMAKGEEVKGTSEPKKVTPKKVGGETRKPAADRSLITRTFFDSIKGKVKFAYYVDGLSGKTSVSGLSGGVNESICENVKAALESWSNATIEVLSDAPKMIIAGTASRGNSVLVMVIDSNYCVIADAEMSKFGVLVGLWNKARKTNGNAT